MDDDSEYKKAKGIKMCLIKRELMVKNYEDCLPNNKIILKSQQRFKRIKSDYHELYTEEINKIALSSNNEKRLQSLIKLQHFHMEKMQLKCARVNR